jgi:hypothetical protein
MPVMLPYLLQKWSGASVHLMREQRDIAGGWLLSQNLVWMGLGT